MQFIINYPYETIENISNAISIPKDKNEFIEYIIQDLYGNYLFSFDLNYTPSYEDMFIYVESIIGKEQIDSLWEFYLQNKEEIDNLIKQQELEENYNIMESNKKLKEKYSLKNYKPNKNCVPVTYKGKKYASKIQACVLEGITRKELDEYLKQEDTANS